MSSNTHTSINNKAPERLVLNYAASVDALIGQVGDPGALTLMPVSDAVTLYVDTDDPGHLRGFEIRRFSSVTDMEQQMIELLVGSEIMNAITGFDIGEQKPDQDGEGVLQATLQRTAAGMESLVTAGGLDEQLARLERFHRLGSQKTERLSGWSYGPRGPTPFIEEQTEEALIAAADQPHPPVQHFFSEEGHSIEVHVRNDVLEVKGILLGSGSFSIRLKLSEIAAELLPPEAFDSETRELVLSGVYDQTGGFRLQAGSLSEPPPAGKPLINAFRID